MGRSAARREDAPRRHRRTASALAVLTGAALLALPDPPQAGAAPERAGKSTVGWIDIDGPISPGTADYLTRVVAGAKEAGYDLLVVRLDTPGGMVDSTREIVSAFLSAPVPVVVWVGPDGARAGSAGVFITMSAHVAAMAPATNIGAAHPVAVGPGGAEEQSDVMTEKIVNDTASWAETIARTRGRNAEWAIRAVRESESITAERAVKLKVVDLLASDREALLRALDGRRVTVDGEPRVLRTAGAEVRPAQPTLRERVLVAMGDPNIAFLLLGLGMLGLMIELFSPGLVVPGVVGGILLATGLVATRLVPLRAGAVVLLLVGGALLVAEMYVTSFGLLALAGVACAALGALLLVDPSDPDFLVDRTFALSWSLVLPPLALAAAFAGFVAWKVLRSRRAPQLVGAAGLPGEEGRALTDVGAQGGEVLVHGEIWRARAAGPIRRGERVRVAAVEGLVLTVRPAGTPA